MSKILYNNKNIEVSYLSFSRKKTKPFVFTKDQLRSIVLPPFGKFLVARLRAVFYFSLQSTLRVTHAREPRTRV